MNRPGRVVADCHLQDSLENRSRYFDYGYDNDNDSDDGSVFSWNANLQTGILINGTEGANNQSPNPSPGSGTPPWEKVKPPTIFSLPPFSERCKCER